MLNHSQITPEETRNLPQYSGLPQPCLAVPIPSANFEERVQHSGLNSSPSPLSSVPPLSAGIIALPDLEELLTPVLFKS